ncbi:hypothetical protein BC938DRAFT_474014 [Jimgerdemannia flammicorona]|uniref:Uncharacterized protein n=1 Tax=Jimgerdemannia flammicorona TaxID=994334 RepID=A0A433Q2X0_9FUNG|nr:hypothetical protein BC938DRAFT_474014 [Jimgerdemannia flammicorona]
MLVNRGGNELSPKFGKIPTTRHIKPSNLYNGRAISDMSTIQLLPYGSNGQASQDGDSNRQLPQVDLYIVYMNSVIPLAVASLVSTDKPTHDSSLELPTISKVGRHRSQILMKLGSSPFPNSTSPYKNIEGKKRITSILCIP